MSRALIIHRAGPGVTVQDMGRPGYLAFGLSRGGAADRLALYEGAALLGQPETPLSWPTCTTSSASTKTISAPESEMKAVAGPE